MLSAAVLLLLHFPAARSVPQLERSTFSSADFHRDGYSVVRQLLSNDEVAALRQLIQTQYQTLPWLRGDQPPFTTGLVAPGLVGSPTWRPLLPVVTTTFSKPRLHAALKEALNNSKYTFADMAEIQVNRSCDWHRDVLHGNDASAYKAGGDLWSRAKSQYAMARLIIYLQPHTDANDKSGLQVQPGTHLIPGCTSSAECGRRQARRGMPPEPPLLALPKGAFAPGAGIVLHPEAGDGILFDMRLVHRGQQHPPLA